MKKTLLPFLLFLLSFTVLGQYTQLSERSQVSLLTISPAEELYSTFGHSAIRITDPENGIDQNYNYGSFDFEADWFYLKFLRGTLPYQISSYDFSREFYYWTSPDYQGRGVIQQILNLNLAQKQKVYELLEENLKPANRNYAYRFFFDNCSTRLQDILDAATDNRISYNKTLHADSTYRQWIDVYAKENNKLWSDFAMDIAIGVPSDAVTDWDGALFLPYNLKDALETASIQTDSTIQPLVLRESILAERSIYNPVETITPIIFFSLIFLLVLYLTRREIKIGRYNKWLDKTLFTITGFCGLVFCLLWFATDHGVTNQNFNILWGLPLVLVAVWKTGNFTKKVFLLQLIAGLLLIVGWPFIPQGLNPAIVPIIGSVIIRSYILWKRN